MDERINKALKIAVSGMNDGAHHKMWVIDQMVRALTGCPEVTLQKLDWKGNPFSYKTQGKSEEYEQWLKKIQYDENGDYYEWETGIAP